MDADTGHVKRFWGAYGNKPDDSVFENASVTGDQKATGYDPQAPPAQQFRHAVHCVMVSKDDFVYVCDRQSDRIQVFTKEGKFVKEAFIAKDTRTPASVWDIAFSADPQQTYLYVGDGENELIHILRRDTLEELTAFGDGGRQPGQFYGVHVIATDSKGQSLHRRDLRRPPRAALPVQGGEAGHQEISGCPVARVCEVEVEEGRQIDTPGRRRDARMLPQENL